MEEQQAIKTSVGKFIDETLLTPETKMSPEMVAAIAELIKAFYLLD